MAYCTQTDILGEIQQSDLIALTDDNNDLAVNSTVLAQVLQNASDFIDSYLSNIYATPLSPAPTIVKAFCVIISCYRLYRRREVPDEKNKFREEYLRVVKQLEGIGKGEAYLDLTVARDFAQVAYTGRSTVYGTIGTNELSTSM